MHACREYLTLFIKNGSKRIDLLGSLAHQAVARTKENSSGDLFLAFWLDEPHLGALRGDTCR